MFNTKRHTDSMYLHIHGWVCASEWCSAQLIVLAFINVDGLGHWGLQSFSVFISLLVMGPGDRLPRPMCRWTTTV